MENVIVCKSKDFAIRIIKLYRFLKEERREHVMSRQILRCGTSIGANVREAEVAISKAEFVQKFNISLKESHETAYWLELLHETDFITDQQFHSIYEDCIELRKLLFAIIKTTNKNR